MTDYRTLEQQFREILDLKQPPVAVTFLSEPPAGVEKFAGSEPSGCSFWRLAAQGRAFYTVPSDHYNCPVGSYTHKIELPADRARELPDILGTMTNLGYLKMEEVPGIPVLKETPKVIVYAPLSKTPVDPDVVLMAAVPAKLMLLEEAALRAGLASNLPLLARPTCMAIPAALGHGMVTSAGCIGNRVYTDLGEHELYSAIPGSALQSIADALQTVLAANGALAEYHQGRRKQLSTA
ncbi:MAG TPA: DUF169 domain-containing protein [Bryobacteraceae bacterium]|nr:DUF169 domain-containing protein [Bryobacteraceae bacterium]